MPKKRTPMTKQLPAFLARTQFGQLMERASKNHERFIVTKNGQAKVVILGFEDFLKEVADTAPAPAEARELTGKKGGKRKQSLPVLEAVIAKLQGT